MRLTIPILLNCLLVIFVYLIDKYTPAKKLPYIAKQIITQHAQSVPVTTRSSLKHKVLLASIESTSSARAIYNNIDIIFWRNADVSLGFNCTVSSSGWSNYQP
mgnify:CR=1 FL=1